MKNVLIWIGSFVISLILIAVPILLPISIIFKWNPVAIMMLGGFTLFEFIMYALELAMNNKD